MDSKPPPPITNQPASASASDNTYTDPHDPTQNIPDAAYPDSPYRPGSSYSGTSQTQLHPINTSSASNAATHSPTHLQPRQWPPPVGQGQVQQGQAGPSALVEPPPPSYEQSQSQSSPSHTTSQPPSSYAPSVPQPVHTQHTGEAIPMSTLSSNGTTVYGPSSPSLQHSQQQQQYRGGNTNGVGGPATAGRGGGLAAQNGGPGTAAAGGKFGTAGYRKRRSRRRLKICVFIVIAVLVLIIGLVVGVALGVLRSKINE